MKRLLRLTALALGLTLLLSACGHKNTEPERKDAATQTVPVEGITGLTLCDGDVTLRFEKDEEGNWIWHDDPAFPLEQSAMDELFDRIIAYIDDNIYDPLTIPEICEHFSLSRSALQLLFKNSVDQSPKKYINDKKLERSCQMLLENRYTISEISLRLGYSSIHYFSKSFNMKYHMSPSEFVKQNCQSSV